MNEYFVGTDLKFLVSLKAEGFSMDTDDWQVEVYLGSRKRVYTKEEMIPGSDGYYLPIDTTNVPPCVVKMVATAQVPDSDMPDGYRSEVGVTTLCILKKTL